MKQSFICLCTVLLTCLSVSCSDSPTKIATQLLDEANQAYQNGEYNTALLLLDSIHNSCPTAVGVRKDAQLLGYRLNLAQEEQTLRVTDSLLTLLVPHIDSVVHRNFVFLKSEYDELGRYIYKGSEAEKNADRSYIHAAVDEYGRSQLISSYRGSSLGHTQLRITCPDGTSCVTHEIPYDDGENYRYKIGGVPYETVTYMGEKDGGTLSFVHLHASQNLTATLLGGKREVAVRITPNDRRALAASHELSLNLSNKLRFEQENKVAQGKISYLRNLIGRKTSVDTLSVGSQSDQ